MADKVTKAQLKNGEILLGFRKQNKLTQSELGKIVGLDSRDISKYEKGLRAIPQEAVDVLNSTYNLKLKSTGKVVKYRISGKGISPIIPDKKTTPKKTTFAQKLKAIREAMHLTQQAFAKKFKFEPSRLSRIEAKKTTNVDVNSLKALDKAGVDIVSLVR